MVLSIYLFSTCLCLNCFFISQSLFFKLVEIILLHCSCSSLHFLKSIGLCSLLTLKIKALANTLDLAHHCGSQTSTNMLTAFLRPIGIIFFKLRPIYIQKIIFFSYNCTHLLINSNKFQKKIKILAKLKLGCYRCLLSWLGNQHIEMQHRLPC